MYRIVTARSAPGIDVGSVHARQLTRPPRPSIRTSDTYEDYDVPFNNHVGIDFRPTRGMHVEHVSRIDFHRRPLHRRTRMRKILEDLINSRDIFRYRDTRREFRYSLLSYFGYRYNKRY